MVAEAANCGNEPDVISPLSGGKKKEKKLFDYFFLHCWTSQTLCNVQHRDWKDSPAGIKRKMKKEAHENNTFRFLVKYLQLSDKQNRLFRILLTSHLLYSWHLVMIYYTSLYIFLHPFYNGGQSVQYYSSNSVSLKGSQAATSFTATRGRRCLFLMLALLLFWLIRQKAGEGLCSRDESHWQAASCGSGKKSGDGVSGALLFIAEWKWICFISPDLTQRIYTSCSSR